MTGTPENVGAVVVVMKWWLGLSIWVKLDVSGYPINS